jgi:hypothetical protein
MLRSPVPQNLGAPGVCSPHAHDLRLRDSRNDVSAGHALGLTSVVDCRAASPADLRLCRVSAGGVPGVAKRSAEPVRALKRRARTGRKEDRSATGARLAQCRAVCWKEFSATIAPCGRPGTAYRGGETGSRASAPGWLVPSLSVSPNGNPRCAGYRPGAWLAATSLAAHPELPSAFDWTLRAKLASSPTASQPCRIYSRAFHPRGYHPLGHDPAAMATRRHRAA